MTEIYINPRSLLTWPEVVEILKMSRSTITRMMKDGVFPPPILKPQAKRKSGPSTVRKYWVYQDIIKFMDSMKSGDFKKYTAKNKGLLTGCSMFKNNRLIDQ